MSFCHKYFGCDKGEMAKNKHVSRFCPSEELLVLVGIHVVMTSQLVIEKLYPTSRLFN